MAHEATGVTLGLSAVAALLFYFSMQIKESEDFLMQNMSVLFVGFGLAMLQIVAMASLQIAIHTAISGLTGVVEASIYVITFANVVYFFSFFIKAVWAMITYGWAMSLEFLSGRRVRNKKEGYNG